MDPHVKQLYDLAGRAVSARESMRLAVQRGTVSEYHRTLREVPEVKLASPLLAVRSRLNELSKQRKRASIGTINDNGATATLRQFEVDDITKAMSAMAHGTLMWVDAQLGRQTVTTSDVVNSSGEEQ